MKTTFLPLITIFAILIVACSPRKQTKQGDVPYVDVTKKYPLKEFYVTDIADVTYVVLCSDDPDFLYRGFIASITENTIIVRDLNHADVFFFSKDGTPKSRFNRKGQGPEEYLRASRIIYDETTDDVFLTCSDIYNRIFVYSSTGEHKRAIGLPQRVRRGSYYLSSLDDRSLLLRNEDSRAFRIPLQDLPNHISSDNFYRICKMDGSILDSFQIQYTPIHAEIVIVDRNNMATRTNLVRGIRMVQSKEGVRLNYPELGTFFLYKPDGSLTPVMHQIPLPASLNPPIAIASYIDVGRYQLLEIAKGGSLRTTWDGIGTVLRMEHYMRNKQTGKIVRPKFLLPDYKGKVLLPGYIAYNPFEFGRNVGSSRPVGFGSNRIHGHLFFQLCLSELKRAHRDNKLSGKLKELVTTLDEDKDNDVFVILNLK
jgi:hypothetical protein